MEQGVKNQCVLNNLCAATARARRLLTHVVDGPQPEPDLPILVLTEDDLPKAGTDLCPPDAHVCSRHGADHRPHAGAGRQRHLLCWRSKEEQEGSERRRRKTKDCDLKRAVHINFYFGKFTLLKRKLNKIRFSNLQFNNKGIR